MATIVLFGGKFCQKDRVVKEIVATTGLRVLSDDEVVKEAAKRSGKDTSKIIKVFSARTSVFNKFTMEKEIAVAYLKLALANMLAGDSMLVRGYTGLLIPKEISHVLRVCLIADMPYRSQMAVKDLGVSEREAAKMIRNGDMGCAAWTRALFDKEDPWDPSLFDMVIPMDKRTSSEAATAILQNATKPVLQPSLESKQAIDDFRLAARVETALFSEGHHVTTSAARGVVTLVINRHVLMLKRLEEELKAVAEKVDGVESVITEVGKDFHKSQIYRKHDFKAPSRVLLVDDEREFVETLSERLMIRDVGAAVAHDGQSALSVIENDDPEVMILDLKMPDISGMDILEKVKRIRPEIEVIVLTGHGSDVDRETCLNMGAFAYLQKPVEIEELNEVIQRANEKFQTWKKNNRQ